MELDFSRVIAESSAPFFDGSKLIWAAVFIVLSIFFSIMTVRVQHGLVMAGQRTRAILYWAINAVLLIIGLIFITKAFPRLSPWVIVAVLFVLLLVGSGATVATKSKDKDKGAEGAKK